MSLINFTKKVLLGEICQDVKALLFSPSYFLCQTKSFASLHLAISDVNHRHVNPNITFISSMTHFESFHSSPPNARTTRINMEHVLNPRYMQNTMNKIMGISGHKKLKYKPGTQQLKHPSTIRAENFQPVSGKSDDKDAAGAVGAPTPGNQRRARQLSDVMYLRITEMMYSGSIHPIISEHSLEILKVQIMPNLRNLNIYWATTGNLQTDKIIHEMLNTEVAWTIRQQLAGLQIMGRTPTVCFIADDSRVRLRSLTNLIEAADKPPEEEEATVSEKNKDGSDPKQQMDEAEVMSHERIVTMAAGNNAPTWNVMEEQMMIKKEALGLNAERLLLEVMKNQVKPQQLKLQTEESSKNEDGWSLGAEDSVGPQGWRLRSEDRDALSQFLKERKRKKRGSKGGRRKLRHDEKDEDQDFDDWDDNDYEIDINERDEWN